MPYQIFKKNRGSSKLPYPFIKFITGITSIDIPITKNDQPIILKNNAVFLFPRVSTDHTPIVTIKPPLTAIITANADCIYFHLLFRTL